MIVINIGVIERRAVAEIVIVVVGVISGRDNFLIGTLITEPADFDVIPK